MPGPKCKSAKGSGGMIPGNSETQIFRNRQKRVFAFYLASSKFSMRATELHEKGHFA